MNKKMKIFIYFGLLSVLLLVGDSNNNASAAPLTVHPTNPRYFTDGTGKAVYLTGSHTWSNLQSWGPGHPLVDFTEYLNFLDAKNHNVIRLWVTDTSWRDSGGAGACEPQPFLRTGPGTALRGGLKFDLTKFNQAYFDSLYSKVSAAQSRGIYVIVMLFDTWGVNGYGIDSGTWPGNPYNQGNNINGINGDPNGDDRGLEIHTLNIAAVTRLQEAYVRKVIDTVNGFDNVLYEVINEGHCDSDDWQNHFVNYIKNYESSKLKQHLVGLNILCSTDQIAQSILLASDADFISPPGSGSSALYSVNPPAANGNKIIITDTDHLEYPRKSTDLYIPRIWVWKSFLRGLNPIFMDTIYDIVGGTDTDKPGSENARLAMGYTLAYAEKMNLVSMTPSSSSSDCSTTYCLINPGNEYLIYQPVYSSTVRTSFTVNLPVGSYTYEWFNPSTGAIAGTGNRNVTAAGSQSFQPSFYGDSVLYVKKSAAYCGDGSCNNNETCTTCPGDCGACPAIPPVSGWTACAFENQQCSFSGTKEVLYGANSLYYSGIYTNSVLCANSVFGDPIIGIQKYCYYRDVSNTAPSAPTGVRVI